MRTRKLSTVFKKLAEQHSYSFQDGLCHGLARLCDRRVINGQEFENAHKYISRLIGHHVYVTSWLWDTQPKFERAWVRATQEEKNRFRHEYRIHWINHIIQTLKKEKK